jgi:hypothetical protein
MDTWKIKGARVFVRGGVKTGSATRTGLRRAVRPALALLLATVTLLLAGPASPHAEAASGCAGRPRRTLRFATGELRIYQERGYVCALTAARKPGARRAMSVGVQPRGGYPVVDSGRYTRRAGPVTVYALHRCVRFSGAVAGKKAATGWILC